MKGIPRTNIDAYIAGFPPETQALLQQVRQLIIEAAPEATESISYGIPTFTLNGNLVHFAAYKNHIGLHTGHSAVKAFAGELAGYSTSKGTIQFPLNRPLPVELIRQITFLRVAENMAKPKNQSRHHKPASG